MNILHQIVAATRQRVERDKERMPVFQAPPPRLFTSFAFEKALEKEEVSFICEVKKASPSKGIIAEGFPYVEIAREYEEAGADAISVLTEPDYFMGSDTHMSEIRSAVNLPLLRKDFIIDPYQIQQSRFLGADAILLIAAIISPAQIRQFIGLADEYGLSSLVEVHDEKELKIALEAGARVIGVNNRDLRTFTVDLQNSIRLRRLTPIDVIFVAESGIRTAEDITALRESGVNAVLIGETLMRAKEKKGILDELKGRDVW